MLAVHLDEVFKVFVYRVHSVFAAVKDRDRRIGNHCTVMNKAARECFLLVPEFGIDAAANDAGRLHEIID